MTHIVVSIVVSDTGQRYQFATWRKAVRFALAAEFNVERIIDDTGRSYAFDYQGRLHQLEEGTSHQQA